ncbi:MAG: hypothetical protein ACODAG_07730 [Myxococcota bacterium]
MARGASGEQPYADFLEAIEMARLRFEETLVEQVRAGTNAAGNPDWRASAWLLERRFPETWGQTVQVTAKVDAELRAALERLRTQLDPATFRRVAQILAEEPDAATKDIEDAHA